MPILDELPHCLQASRTGSWSPDFFSSMSTSRGILAGEVSEIIQATSVNDYLPMVPKYNSKAMYLSWCLAKAAITRLKSFYTFHGPLDVITWVAATAAATCARHLE